MAMNKHPMSSASARTHERLEECASRLKIKRHTLAQNAIEAAIEAIENGYRLSLPMRFHFAIEPESEMARHPADKKNPVAWRNVASIHREASQDGGELAGQVGARNLFRSSFRI
jgi:hypothetical protein